MELHELGPVKLFDTAGIDEAGQLGEKKRRKTLSALKECDVSVVVVDVQRQQALLRGAGLQESLQESSSSEALQRHLQDSLKWEQGVLQDAGHYGVVPLLLLNLKGCRPGPDTQALVRAIQVGGQEEHLLVTARHHVFVLVGATQQASPAPQLTGRHSSCLHMLALTCRPCCQQPRWVAAAGHLTTCYVVHWAAQCAIISVASQRTGNQHHVMMGGCMAD